MHQPSQLQLFALLATSVFASAPAAAAGVDYRGRQVSDARVRTVLLRIAERTGRTVVVTSGDRRHVPRGGSQTSWHLRGRAADFYVQGQTLRETFELLQRERSSLLREGVFEVIHHGDQTNTGGPHLHLANQGSEEFLEENRGRYRSVTPPSSRPGGRPAPARGTPESSDPGPRAAAGAADYQELIERLWEVQGPTGIAQKLQRVVSAWIASARPHGSEAARVRGGAERLLALRRGNVGTISSEELSGVAQMFDLAPAVQGAMGNVLAQFQQEMALELMAIAQSGLQQGSSIENNRPFEFRGETYGWARFQGRPVPVKWGSVAGTGSGAASAAQPATSSSSASAPSATGRSGLDRIESADDPLAVAIGHAEGNRTVSGERTASYYGHTDPGNGVRNQGTFSAQQGYANAAAADAAWIGKLNRKLPEWSAQIARHARPGSLGHSRLLSSAADLYVQAPAAVPDFVRQAPKIAAEGFSPEAIARARADSFVNPRTGRLEAAGFRNSYGRLLVDQRRRGAALRAVLER